MDILKKALVGTTLIMIGFFAADRLIALGLEHGDQLAVPIVDCLSGGTLHRYLGIGKLARSQCLSRAHSQ